MIFKTFGNREYETIILLHGGGLSWWSYQEIIEHLKERYYVVSVVIDGHGENSDQTFTSIENPAEQLIDFIDNEANGQVFALMGLSLGAQIIVETITRRKNIAKYAVIESALLCPMKLVEKSSSLMIHCTYWLIKQRWFSDIQAKALFVPKDKLELYYADSIKISKRSLINISKSNASFELKDSISKTEAKVLIIVGEKEIRKIQLSAQKLSIKTPNSKLYIAKNMKHGELSLSTPEQYFELITSFFNGSFDAGHIRH
ncbi:MAG: alpha/beta hydrolase [Bacteroidales bacterium]|nr:alpha/beta hydrolase [Bacteroidales bacterium]